MPLLYLLQKDAEIRLRPDQEAYDAIVEAGHVVGHHMSNPIVELPNMTNDLPDSFENLDVPDEPFTNSYPTCDACGATDDWEIVTQYPGEAGTAHVVKCMAKCVGYGGTAQRCEHLAVAYAPDDGTIEYAGHATEQK